MLPTARASSESDDRRWFSISLGVQTLWWCLHTSIVSSGLRDSYDLHHQVMLPSLRTRPTARLPSADWKSRLWSPRIQKQLLLFIGWEQSPQLWRIEGSLWSQNLAQIGQSISVLARRSPAAVSNGFAREIQYAPSPGIAIPHGQGPHREHDQDMVFELRHGHHLWHLQHQGDLFLKL